MNVDHKLKIAVGQAGHIKEYCWKKAIRSEGQTEGQPLSVACQFAAFGVAFRDINHVVLFLNNPLCLNSQYGSTSPDMKSF